MNDYTLILLIVLLVWSIAPPTPTPRQQQQQQQQHHQVRNHNSRVRTNVWNWYRWIRQYLYTNVYLRHRSRISLCIAWVLYFPSWWRRRSFFQCSCCCDWLGGQDHDTEYSTTCICSSTTGTATTTTGSSSTTNTRTKLDSFPENKYCFLCVSTYFTNQIQQQRRFQLKCFNNTCTLDDRLIRRRLTPVVLMQLDRLQITHAAHAATVAAAATAAVATKGSTSNFIQEKFWQCPMPDCYCCCFISNQHSSQPPTVLQRVWTSLTVSTAITLGQISNTNLYKQNNYQQPYHTDPRCVRCPSCQISSCQFCGRVWSYGVIDHNRWNCQKYEEQLRCNHSKDTLLLQQWHESAQTQNCPQCYSSIEKNAGCNHVTCRCGYEFCWICGDEWTTQHSYFCRKQKRNQLSSSFLRNHMEERPTDWWTTWLRGWFG